MIENIAIIVLAFLTQLNIASDGNGIDHMLDQFVETESINEHLSNDNWDVYRNISEEQEQISPLPYKVSNDEIEINSDSAIAFDVGTDYVLYSKDAKKKLPIASLSKIVTALVVLEKSDLNDVVTISRSAFEVSGKKERLFVGEKITVDNLLKMMLVSSNNVAASALGEHSGGDLESFIELMNQKVGFLGLEDTVFYNLTGLDQKDINISTAYDIAQLVDYALEEPIIWEYSRIKNVKISSLDGRTNHWVKNTNQLLGKLEDVVGGKTGFTDIAGQCLVLITNDPSDKTNQVITVVLNAEDRFLQTQRLKDWIWKNYQW